MQHFGEWGWALDIHGLPELPGTTDRDITYFKHESQPDGSLVFSVAPDAMGFTTTELRYEGPTL